jgi:O-antigen/teichoic acid export membrane protein
VSVTRRIAFGAAASWFNRGLTILLGLVLLPVLFGHMPKEELGIWLLLGQSWATMGILDFGISVTITRRIALAKGKSGGDPNGSLSNETQQEIADLVACGQRIYRLLAIVVFFVAWIAGFFYLRHLELHGISHSTVWIAWTILCASQALSVWAAIWTCLLQGVGYIGWDAIIGSLIAAATLLTQIIVVLLGGRLIALAAVATIGVLVQRSLMRWFSRKRRPELFALRGRWNPDVLRGVPGLAFHAWLTSLGVILVQNTDGFFIASLQGADKIPAYRAAFLVVLNLHMLATVFASSSAVFISHLWQAGQIEEVQRIVQRNLRLGLSIVLCGGAAIIAAGPSLFNVWIGPSNYVGLGLVALFVATFVFEQQTFVISTGSRATEDEAFGVAMISGGILKLILAFILIKRFGLIGLAAGTIIAQFLTAYWFVLYRGLRRLQFGFKRYCFSVFLPCLLVFGAALAATNIIVGATQGQSDWFRLLGACLGSGTVLALAMWFLVLDTNQRGRTRSLVTSRVASRSTI